MSLYSTIPVFKGKDLLLEDQIPSVDPEMLPEKVYPSTVTSTDWCIAYRKTEWVDGLMDDLGFYLLFNGTAVFQSYQDDGRVIMKGCVPWDPFYD